MNPAVVSPAPTVTLAGTVRLALLLERGTANPPAGAAPVSETVHPVLVGVLRVVVVQPTALRPTAAGSVMTPAPPEAGMGVPATVDATTPLTITPIEVVEGLAAIWNVATATMPSPKVVVLNPNARQVFPEQLSVLPPAVVDPPAATLTRVMSDE